jgi:hypothetical protein
MYKRVEIFDRDGTLTCSLHRTIIDDKGILDLGHWLENYTAENVQKDKLLPTADYYKQCIADPEVYTVIITVALLPQWDIDYINNTLGKPDKLIFPKKNVGNLGGAWKVRALAFLNTLKQFADLPKVFHEDNLKYLAPVCDKYGWTGKYYPSGYGVAGVKNVPDWLETEG